MFADIQNRYVRYQSAWCVQINFRFSDKVEHIMSYISCLEIFNGTCIACLVGYCIIMVNDSNRLIL